MPKYTYSAQDQEGKVVRATVEAQSVQDAVGLIRERGMFPLSIDAGSSQLFPRDLSIVLDKFSTVSSKDRVIFTRQLSTLIKAGLPVARALRMAQAQITSKKLAKVIDDISNKVEGGATLSGSLSGYPTVFNEIYTSMVSAGETSGTLDETLQRLAAQEEKTQRTISKVRGALIYPCVVMVVLVAVSTLMIVAVIPQVASIYDELHAPLPLYTQALVWLSDIIKQYWWVILIVLALIARAMFGYLKTPVGKKIIDKFKLIVPVFKTLVKKLYMARFCRTLATLVGAGLPLLQGLEIVGRAINNFYVSQAIGEVADRVKAGEPLSKPISENPYFLPLVGQMLSVGQETGSVAESLDKVADYYEEEVDRAVENIQTLIEPVSIVILGGMVLFLMAAVLLPIYGLVNQIR